MNGLSAPFHDASLSSPVVGIIGSYRYKEGDTVPEGATILELRSEIERIEVTRRKVLLDAATADLERTELLFKTTRSVSKEQMEEKQVVYEVAAAEHEAAVQELKRRAIVAPFAGQIVDFFGLETGESAQLQTPLVRLVDTSKCYFEAHLGTAMVEGLEIGAAVQLEFKSSARESFEGKIIFISSIVDPASGVLKVKAQFDNPEQKIRPGTEGVMLIPAAGKEALAGGS